MLGAETVTVRRNGGYDAHGDPIAGTEFTVADCLVFQAGDAELLTVDRTGARTRTKVTMPITAGVDHTCDIQVRGRWYRIVGDPEPFVNDEDPELSGYEFELERGSG